MHTIIEPTKGEEHLHEIAAEAAAKNYLEGGKGSDFPKHLRAAVRGKQIKVPFETDKKVQALAEGVAKALHNRDGMSKKDTDRFCELFEVEARQLAHWVARAREVGENIPTMWHDLIRMCRRVAEQN